MRQAIALFCAATALICAGCAQNVGDNRSGFTVPPQRSTLGTRTGAIAKPPQVRTEQQIAQEVVRDTHAQNAAVLVAGRTAYVAVQLRRGTAPGSAQLTKDQITRTVKSKHPEIDTIFVSVNPDVYQHMQRFSHELTRGRPVAAVWDNFRAMVQRVWPEART